MMLLPADVNSAFSLLRNELPDPNQELFRSEFLLFRKLPIELRLKIWRSSFPAERRVNAWIDLNGCRSVHFPGRLISACVSRESRAETLKHYQVFQQSGLNRRYHDVRQSDLGRRRCSYFRIHGLLTCVLSRDAQQNSNQVNHSPVGLRFCTLFEGLFRNATREFFPLIGTLRLILDLRKARTVIFDGWLLNLHGLSELQVIGIVGQKYTLQSQRNSVSDIEHCKATVENFFERYPEYSMPKVTIQ